MLKTFLYKVILRSVFLLIFLTELSTVTAQSYTMTNGSVSTCSGTFLDPGGNANYPNNANYTYTICSSNGTQVNAKFTTFKTSANDILYVYDGNSTSAPLMGTYTGTLTYPPSLTSSSTCLTFKFVSDASTNNTGFVATISCVASTIKVDNTTYTQSQLISSVFMGDCLTASNIQFHGMNDMMGYFTNGSSIGINTGIVLTSGSIFNVPGPNNQANATIDHSQPGDAELTAAVGVTTKDASSIEFDFVPKNDSVSFDFVFGSEEYPEWICAGYNDAFGFFVTGTGYAANTNVALIPGTTTPIAIDNINTTGNCATIYPQYYVNNSGGTACQYDGYTVPMRAVIHCVPCETYHIKIAVADVGDGLYDSGVFLKAQSFSAGHNITVSATGQTGIQIYEGCDGYFTFTNLDGVDSLPYNIYYQILGTASNGNDYQTITNMVTIPAGQTTVTLPINTILDANVETSEWVRVKLLTYCDCSNIPQATLIILDNSAFNATVSASQTICQGQVPLTLTASGSQSLPYHYLWSTGATTKNISVSPSVTTTYSVTVTNPCDGATDFASTTVTVIPAINITPVQTNVNCNGNNNGSISLTVTGGQTPYSYLWSNGATTANISGLTPNSYSVTVTAGVCSTTSTFTITQPTVLGLSLSSVNPSCNGVSNGSVSSTLTGGTSPFNYVWNNGATTANRTSLSAGTYSLTVTDANGCTNTATATITNTTSISVSSSSTNAICFGGNNGTASSTVTGGTSPFTYSWSNGATTANISGLTANSYSVTVTDANGCTAIASTTVSQPTVLTASASSTNVSCNSGTNGTASSSVSGGTSPYTYHWSNNATTANISSLTANTYSVVVTDANGCTATSSTIVSQPTTLSVSTTSTNALCNAAANGTASSSVTGGTSPFTYSWSNGATTANISSLTANTYSVVVTDANGCTATSSTIVSQPTTLSVSTTSTNALCNAAANGTASSSVTGGTLPFSYAWSNGATTASITSLIANTYSVVVTDANGCTATSSTTVSQPTTLSVSTSSTNALCNAASNGTATSSVTGGTSPFTYAWSNGATTANISSLTANTYSVVVTDANGCTATSSTIVSQPTTLSVSTSSTNAACNSAANGTATASVTGGTSPFTYAWSNGATTANISSLTANSYSVIVTDANGCTATSSTTVSQPTTLSVSTSSTNSLCNAAANGTATSSVTGGTSPFTYAWSNGATTANISSLTANTYSVVVTDANGCTATSSTTVSQPTTLSVSTSSTNAACNSAANGTATASVTGGTSPFTYSWSNGATTANISSLTANTYSVIVTDANGCTATSSTTVSQPTTLSVSTTSTNALCNAASNGTAAASVTGGTSPFSYAWSNGATTANISSLTANTYSVIVTDANGCTAISSTTVSQPTTLSVSTTSTNALCNAAANGTAAASVTGGTLPFTYSWSNGATTANISGLTANSYSVIVTDANGCTATSSTTVSQPTTLSVSTTSTNALCNAASNGTASSSVTGGTSPFTYSWSNGATTANISSLTANTFSVVVTDANGCTATSSTTVSQPTTLSVSTSSTNALCNTAANGTATSSVTGGTSPFTYAWSNGATTANISSLTANSYSVIVTDANGCTATSSTTVSQPTTLSVSTSSTNALCNAASNGTATSSVTGGTSPFSYAWSNGATTASITSLIANTYSVVVTDANGCTATSSTTVSQPTTLSVSTSSTNALCNAASNGTATASVTGGTSPFTYSWSNGATTANISSLTANTFSVVVTDANGCTATSSTTVSQPTTLSVSTSSTNVLCNAASNGTATTSVTGGTSPFTYSWSNGATTANITSLTANTYSVVVTDANGCTATSSTTVSQPTTLSVSTTSTNALCNAAADGTATASVTGGTSPFTYAWSNGATTANISSLTANSYSVIVTDANGCTATSSTTVSQPTTLSVSTSSTNALCNTASNGTATASVTGGTSPFTYSWSNGATTANISSLTANSYSVIVTDANGCTATSSTTVSQPTTLSVSTSSTNALCNAASNGTATASVTGGTSPFTYAWSNGATTANITSLAANTYSFIVTDANGCTATSSTTVSQPTTLSVSTSSTNALCNAASNGTATSSVTGGTSPFTYAWSNGATTANISSLTANTYSVVVTDANGCTAVSSTSVSQPTTLSVSTSSTNALCNAASNGTATSSVTGGTSPFSYAWSNGATTASITSLIANTYSVVVTDANGCTATSSTTVSQPTTLSVSTSSTNALCNAASNGTATASVTGGTSPFTYSWSNGATTANISSLTANTFSVVVTDANGCTATSSTTVSQPTTLSVSTSSTNVLCNAASNGTATTSVTGGTSPFTYSWSNGATTANITSLTANTYSVVVTDANGCTATSSTTVSQPTTLSVSTTSTNALCNAAADGTATASVTGGTSPFTYAWSNGATTANISSLTANSYSVIVTDANGCTATSSTTVSQPTTLSVSTSSTNALCNTASNGTATASVTGGTSPFTYSWSNGATTANISSLTANSYSVIVTDANGCTATSSTTVSQPTTLSVSTSSTNALCNAASNGTATASVTGGTSPFTYAWSNGATTANITSLAANTYSFIVTDANGCTATSSTTVSQPTTLSVSTSSTNALCNAASNGTATSSVTGGTSPFTYAWSNGATTANISSLTANTYSVVVTDANGCTAVSSTSVSQPTTLSVSTSSTNALCNAASNGTATSSVTGGTSPFTYAWSNGATLASISGLIANNYSVTVTDTNGCTATSSTTVSQPTTLSVSENHTDATCSFLNGNISVSAFGGTLPYIYNWSNSATTNNISNLSPAIYSITVLDVNSCSVTLTVNIINSSVPVSSTVNAAICNGATYTLPNGASINSAGQYITTLTSVSGCDSVITTNLTVNPVYASTVNAAICNGATYTLPNGASINSAGQYITTLTSVSGCDSVITTNLTVNPVYASTVNAAICNGATYTLPNGASINSAGQYITTLTSVSGCDSVITTNLIVNPVYASTVNAAICNGATYTLPNGASINSAGQYITTLTSVSGCDSVITTNLTVNPVYASTVNAAICNGATYTLPNGASINSAGQYITTLTSVSGCDSVITTNLIVNPVYASTVNAAICNGVTYTLPNGASINSAGQYITTLTSVSGCDSVITTNLIVNPVYASTVNAAICNGATYTLPNGASINSAGQYITTLTSVSGCDSVITTNLIVNPVYASTVNAAICNGATYTLPNGTTVTAAGTYTSTLTSVSGCDSVITTNLTINPVYASTVNAAICNGASYTLPSGTSVTVAGTYTSTLTSVSGCDSVITTNITVNPVYAATVNAAICNGATYTLPNGTSVTATGTYTSTLTSVGGCDSVITTNLTVNPVFASTLNATICNGATYTLPSGTSVTAAGTYTSTLTSVSGCDSVITTNLTVNPVYASIVNEVICNGASYTLPNGTTVIAAGTYTSTLTSISGCDSVITTNLIVNPVYASTVNAAICNGATYTLPNGTSVTAAGTYTSTLTSVSGCDSVITTNITVNPVYAATVNAAICNGASYTLPNGMTVTAAGTYTSTLTSINGCDSVITTNLTVGGLTLASVNANSSCGLQNGTINLSVLGGVSPYTYNWSNGSTVEDLINIASGIYSVTVFDNAGCSSSFTTTLNNVGGVIGVNLTINYPTCTVLTNGSVIASAYGSTSPYSYHWSTGSNLPFIFGISSGSYTVTVTSASGCSLDTTIVIPNPVPIIVIDSIVPSVCGNYAAQLYVSVNGGSTPYQFHWSNGATTQDLLYVNGGVYNLTVTDSHNCQGLLSVNIPNILLPYLAETHVDASCGNATGSIDLVPSGGNLPYHFVWSDGETTEDASNLSAGVYSVTAFDANGCTSSLNVIINNSNGPALSETHQDDYCGHSIASIDLSISGGALPYQINWSNGSTSEDLNNISAGNYSVTVTDGNGCSVTSTINVNGLSGQTVSLNSISPICNGVSNGAIGLSVIGGVPNFSYAWSNGATTANISGLTANSYSVTVTDGFGCIVSASTTLIDPVAQIPDTVNAQICSGGNYILPNGISVTAAGTYTSTLSSVSGCDSIITTNLSVNSILTSTVNAQICSGGNYILPNGTSTSSAGQYITTLTSVSGCDSIITTNLSVNSVLTSIVNAQICSGGNYILPNGTSVTAAGAYSTTLSSASGCDSIITTNLSVNSVLASIVNAQICSGGNYVLPNGASTSSAGQYITILTSTSGCDSVVTTNLSVNSVLTSTVNAQFCSGGNYVLPDGSSVATAGTYTTTLTSVSGCDSVITTNLSVNSVLTSTVNVQICSGGNYILPNGTSVTAAGTYTTTLTSASGCDSIITTTLTVGSPTATESHIDAACGLANASIDLNVSGGISPYNYFWSNGATTQDVSALSQGNYFVTVTDSNSCQSILNVSISNINGPVLSENHVNSSCGNSNGAVDLTVTGGVQPMSFVWNNAAATEDINNIPQGIYTVTVTDNNNCAASLQISVGGNNIPAISETHIDASCGNSNASIDLTVGGGASNYTYNWSNGSTTQDLSGIAPGNYFVTVTDANTCQSILSININSNSLNTLTLNENNTPPNCGQNNGSIDLAVTGGTAPYIYQWNNNSTTEDLTGITDGNYNVTVLDVNGCQATLPIVLTCISAPPCLLTVNAVAINASCANLNSGGATLVITNSVSALSYIWSDGSTSQNLSGVVAGNYTVTVNDAIGCTAIAAVSIINTTGPSVSETHSPTSCGGNNGSINLTVAGGSAPYTYNWNNGVTIQNLSSVAAGNYFVTVTDGNNCQAILSVLIENSAPPTLSETHINASCGNNNGAIDLTVANGFAPFSYSWNTGGTTEDPTNMTSGNYTVTVADAANCTAALSVSISNSNAPTVSETHVNTSCGNNNGSVNLTVAGGNSPYFFNWSNGATTQNLTNTAAGNYFVTVTDAANCNAILSVLVENSSAPTLTETHLNASCGNSNGAIDLTVVNGFAPYAYIWNTGGTTEDPTNMTAGNYSVTVSDAFNCSAITTVNISNSSAVSLTETHTSASCGNNNGAINLSVAGGTLPYNYLWNNGSTTQDLGNIVSGNYTVTVTDASNCQSVLSAFINNLNGPTVLVSTSNPTCGQSNGALSLLVNGGTIPYSYNWGNGATTNNLSNLSAGNYAVTVTDQTGCAVFTTTSLFSSSQPVISLTALSSTICSGNATDISATGATTYSWSPSTGLNNSTGSSVSANPIVTTTYTVTGTAAGGCTAVSNIVITVNPNPNLSVIPTASIICPGSSTSITASGATSYLWSPSVNLNSSTGNTVTATPNSTTTYTIVGTLNGCSAMATTVVNVSAIPTVILNTADTAICLGNSVLLSASGSGTTYSWSPSTGLSVTIGSTVSANPIVATTYTVTTTNGIGCSNSSSIIVNVNALPVITASANNNSICAGNSVQLSATGGTTYSWSPSSSLNNSTGATVTATPVSSTTYTVTGIDAATGCSAQATTAIVINSAISISVNASTTSICPGQTAVLTASGANAYSWYPSTGLNMTNGVTVITQPDSTITYTVVGANTSGCTGSANVTVTVGILPDVIVDVLPDEGCAPLTVTFDNHTTGASSFDWTFGDNTSSNAVSPIHTYLNQGTYPVTLVVTGQSGCTDTLSNLASIVVHPSPVADFSVDPGLGVVTTLTDATFTFLNHSLYANHYQWLWGDGSTDTFTSVIHTYQHAGDFNVTLIAMNDYGCADSLTLYPLIVVENGTVFIPNAFTPNGDGLNDVFKIYGTGIQNYTLSIYDRIGEMIYQGDKNSTGWDATFKGVPVNVGVFVYVVDITYDDGTKTNKKGDVTVVR